jgi:hypothetical protein
LRQGGLHAGLEGRRRLGHVAQSQPLIRENALLVKASIAQLQK